MKKKQASENSKTLNFQLSYNVNSGKNESGVQAIFFQHRNNSIGLILEQIMTERTGAMTSSFSNFVRSSPKISIFVYLGHEIDTENPQRWNRCQRTVFNSKKKSKRKLALGFEQSGLKEIFENKFWWKVQWKSNLKSENSIQVKTIEKS